MVGGLFGGAEDVFANHALQVVQHTLVQYRADLGASDSARSGTNQAADQSAGHAAQGDNCRATHQTYGRTDTRASNGTRPAGDAACNDTSGATDFFTNISGGDSGRTTLRALNTHGDAFVKEGMTDARLPAIPKGQAWKSAAQSPEPLNEVLSGLV